MGTGAKVLIGCAIFAVIAFLGGCGILVVAASMSDDDSSSESSSDTTSTTKAPSAAPTTAEAKLFPGRPDSQKDDREREIGKAVEFSGYTTTVTAAGFRQSFDDFQTDGYLVADVTIENRDTRAQPYNTYDWRLQTPTGQVIDPGFVVMDGALSSGDLVQGGKVSGKVPFEVGSVKGDYYLIYKPDFGSTRGIWKVTL